MIRLCDVSVRAGEFRLDRIELEVPPRQYGVLMGTTGSGKTTLAECVCGLRAVAAGRILLGDDDVTRLPPAGRNVGYVPQDGALFPRMSVRRHLAFPLTIRGWSKKEIDRRTDELAERLAIEPLLDRLPANLSGGERQRVALGRALAFHPPVLILDEPLSALDEKTRGEIHDLLKSVQRETGVTTLHITHSRGEADLLADRLLVLRAGKVVATTDTDEIRSA